MSFLFPSVLWGLFASLIPLIVHLFNQNTTKTVEFSSIQHIKALESDSIRSLKLKQWILVLIRSLIIVCLILMCSGPIQRNNLKWVPSTKESVAVVVIDNSASLGVEKNGEIILINSHIAQYKQASISNHKSNDERKLLLNKKEINKLIGKIQREGFTIVPTKMYFKKGKVKVEIAIAKGKRQFDKRATIKKRDWNRDKARYIRK